MHDPWLTSEIKTGNPLYIGRLKIVPFSKVWHLRFPIIHGGIIWNKPASVLLTNGEGLERVYPIRDYTRLALWTLLCIGVSGSLLISGITHLKERQSHHE